MRSDLKETTRNSALNQGFLWMDGIPLPSDVPPQGRRRSQVSSRKPGPGGKWREDEHWEAIADHVCHLSIPNEG